MGPGRIDILDSLVPQALVCCGARLGRKDISNCTDCLLEMSLFVFLECCKHSCLMVYFDKLSAPRV